MALGPSHVHIAAQGAVEVLQGFLFHLHLPLGHKDVLPREAAPSAGVGRAALGEGLAVASRRTPPCLTCTRPNLP